MKQMKLRCVCAVATREVDWKCACSPLLSIKALATYVIPEQCRKCCIILRLSELLPHSQKPFPEAFLCFHCCVPACQRSLRHAAHRRPLPTHSQICKVYGALTAVHCIVSITFTLLHESLKFSHNRKELFFLRI